MIFEIALAFAILVGALIVFTFDLFPIDAVAILIPSVIALACEHRRTPSKLLIPLSFFSQLAGVIILIGTSTNIPARSINPFISLILL